MDKLDKLKKIFEVATRDTISASEIEKFLILALETIKKERETFKNISAEQIKIINESIQYIESKRLGLSYLIEKKTDTTKLLFTSEMDAVKKLLAQIKLIKTTPGKNGKDGVNGKDGKKGSDGKDGFNGIDGKNGIDGSPDKPEDIRDKLETLKGEERLDAKYIKNLPKGGTVGGNASGVKEVVAGTGITVDNTNYGYPIISSSGGAGAGNAYAWFLV